MLEANAEGAETNAEGMRIEAPMGMGMGSGCSPLQLTRGSGGAS